MAKKHKAEDMIKTVKKMEIERVFNGWIVHLTHFKGGTFTCADLSHRVFENKEEFHSFLTSLEWEEL